MYEDILTRKTIGGKEHIITKKRWQMVTTHTARRSCATNLFLRGVPITTIMLITNHRSEAQCREYIKDFTRNEVDKKVAELDFWKKKEDN